MSEAAQHRSGDEFEREPVPEKALKGASAFWGMYAGEHTAGTEFMIGPLFVAWGASAFDLIFGLLLGNLMAVLTWRFLTAEIATRQRLTLYFKLEKICGRKLVTLYNFFNGVLFCFLAGAMVTVSATAVGVPFGDSIRMPSFDQTMPTGIVWCVHVPGDWRGDDLRGGARLRVRGARGALWRAVDVPGVRRVRRGDAGQAGLDESVRADQSAGGRAAQDRFLGRRVLLLVLQRGDAPRACPTCPCCASRANRRYGWASAAGMFLGHYVAWICAALLLVYWVRTGGADPTKGVTPGPMVYDAVGWAGLICVVIAGWTTANPTIYRAGLAFQGMFPKMSRTTGTIIAGAVCTMASVFPAFAMKLLDFVGIYGTILCPVGAIIVVDHFLAQRGWASPADYAERHGIRFNVAVLLAWVIPVAIGLGIYQDAGGQLVLPAAAVLARLRRALHPVHEADGPAGGIAPLHEPRAGGPPAVPAGSSADVRTGCERTTAGAPSRFMVTGHGQGAKVALREPGSGARASSPAAGLVGSWALLRPGTAPLRHRFMATEHGHGTSAVFLRPQA